MALLDLSDELTSIDVMERFFAHEVCAAATSRAAGSAWRSAVRCQTGRGRWSCGAYVEVARSKRREVRWSCQRCGCGGTIVGYERSASDLAAYSARGKLRMWGLDEGARDVLLQATADLPSLRAVIMRASPHEEIADLLVTQGTLKELDEMYSLVEALLDIGGRSRKRRELLDALRQSLCTAIDGY